MLRKFRDSDAEECSKIIVSNIEKNRHMQESIKSRLYKSSTPKSLIKRKKKFNYIVFEKNKKVIGIGGLNGKEIRSMYVNQKFQGLGIGTKILSKLEGIARKNKLKNIFLYTHTKPSRFYIKNGWKTIKKYKKDKGKSVFYMEKIL